MFKNNGVLFQDEDWNRLKETSMQDLSLGLLHS